MLNPSVVPVNSFKLHPPKVFAYQVLKGTGKPVDPGMSVLCTEKLESCSDFSVSYGFTCVSWVASFRVWRGVACWEINFYMAIIAVHQNKDK